MIDSIGRAIDYIENEEDSCDPRSKMKYLDQTVDKEDKTLSHIEEIEINDNISDLIKDLTLSGGMYDYSFWKFFNETNPLVLNDLRLKLFMTFVVHSLVIWYAFVDKL